VELLLLMLLKAMMALLLVRLWNGYGKAGG
jgi:hypothetical protein